MMIFKLTILFHYLRVRFLLKFKNRNHLLRWQETKVQSFIQWAKASSPFYSQWCDGIPIHLWRSIPIIDKAIMMENLDSLNTVGISRNTALSVALQAEQSRDFTPQIGNISVGLSTGTSGNRGLFLVSDSERAKYAGTIMAKVLPNSLFSKNRVAFFMRANNNLYTASRNKRLQFEFFDIIKPIEEHLPLLQELQPTLIFAPPSILLKLASALQSGNIQVRPLRIFSIAETLDPLDQKRIEKAFQMPVHQIYQCTEGFLGASCSLGTLHLNEDLVSIEPEWIDQNLRKFIPIVTDFSRRTQPIIRYRLNDILTARSKPCPCGSPTLALESIEGRSDDIIFFPDQTQSQWVSVMPDFIRRAIIRASDQIVEYLAIQESVGSLKIYLKIEHPTRLSNTGNTGEIGNIGEIEKIEAAVLYEFQKLCSEINSSMPQIHFTQPSENIGYQKLRRVRRLCPAP